MAGFGGLAGFVAGDPVGAYRKGRVQDQQVSQGDVDAQAQSAAGNAYMGMFGAQQTPGQPAGQPQGPTQQQGGMLQQLLAKLRGGGSPQQPMMPPPGPGMGQQPGGMPPQSPGGPMPGQPQQGPPQAAAVPGARPMMPPQGGGMPPGGMAPQPMGQQPPQMGGGGQQGGMPQLTWQSIVQSVVKSNPGVKDPRVIAAAVDKFLPLMNQQTQQEWRQMSLMLAGQRAATGQERADTSRDQGQQRIDQGSQRLDETVKRDEAIQTRSDRRETRLDRESALKQDQQHNILDMQRQKLEAQIAQNKDRTQLGQWRALLDAQHKRATEIITSAGGAMDPKERKRLLDEENTFYEDKIKEMRQQMQPREEIIGGGTGDGKPVKTETITKPSVKVKTPEDAAKLAPGTKYVTPDGQEFTR